MLSLIEFIERIFDRVEGWRINAIIRQRIKSENFDKNLKVVVYTAIFGKKDTLQEVDTVPGTDYVCFTDDDELTSKSWRIVKVKKPFDDARKSAKIYKILPHQFFSEYDYSLWVDGTHVPIIDVRYLIHKFLVKSDIAMFSHRKRRCIYKEMEACIRYNKANPDIVKLQEQKYRRENYPANNGLTECTVILRRHHTPKLKAAMEDWWGEITQFTLRDQLSFNYVAYRHKLSCTLLPGNIHNNSFFRFKGHFTPDLSHLNVGWILNGDKTTASTRMMGYNIHEYLRSKNIYSRIFYTPQGRIAADLRMNKREMDDILNFNINILVIVKLNKGIALDYLIRNCKRRNIKIVYAVCDLPSVRMVKAADAIIATSPYFYKAISKKYHSKLNVIFDGYEQSDQLTKVHHEQQEITLCFVSNQVWDKFPCIERLPEHVRLKIIGPGPQILSTSFKDSMVFKQSRFEFDYVPWSLETVFNEIMPCDVAVIPWPSIGPEQKLKSINRLVMFMAMGIPVIASPIPSYQDVIRHGENGFIAQSPEEWEKYILFLRDHPQERKRMGMNARKDVVGRYSKKEQRALYLQVLTKILQEARVERIMEQDRNKGH